MIVALERSAAFLLLARGRPDASDDAALVARAREGDPSGFDEIVRRHQRRVYNLAYRMLHHPEEAEDITQEAFVAAYQRFAQLRDPESVGAWICRIAANLCLDRLRSPGHRSEVLMPAPEMADTGVMDERTAESAERIRGAMADLPPKYRLAVVAYYLLGHSYEEAARMIGVGVRTFKTRLYRARQRLALLLQESGGTGEDGMP